MPAFVCTCLVPLHFPFLLPKWSEACLVTGKLISYFSSAYLPPLWIHYQHAPLSTHSPQSLDGSLEYPSPIQPSHQVSSADYARNSTPSPAGTFPGLGKVSPCTLKPLLDRLHFPDASPSAIRPPRIDQLPLHTGFSQPSFVTGIDS